MIAGKYQPYNAYQDAQSKWLDSIPQHWVECRLKQIVSDRVTDGPHETPKFEDEGVPFLSAEAVKGRQLDFSRKRGFICRELHELYSKKCLPRRGDIFMVKSGATTGALAMVETDEEFNIWSPLALVRSNKFEAIDRFVFYSMQADFFQRSVQLSWSYGTQPNIGMGVIENLYIARAPLEEQTQITKFLDYETAKIDALSEKQQQLIALLKEKRQAVISHAITKGLNPDAPMRNSGVEWLGDVPAHWEVKRIKNLAAIISKGTTPSTIGMDMADAGTRFIKGENVGKGLAVSRSPQFYISEVTDRILERSRLKRGDVLVIIAGATTGLCSVVENDVLPANTNQAVSFIRPMLPGHSHLIARWLSTEFAQRTIWMDAVQAAQPNLSMEDLGNIPIAVPPIKELERILKELEAEIERFDKLSEHADAMAELLVERRTALISAAVTGKIDVRGWQAPEIEAEVA